MESFKQHKKDKFISTIIELLNNGQDVLVEEIYQPCIIEEARAMISNNVNVKKLFEYCESGNIQGVKQLLNSGISTNVTNGNHTLLLAALSNNNKYIPNYKELVEVILSYSETNVNAHCKEGNGALYLCHPDEDSTYLLLINDFRMNVNTQLCYQTSYLSALVTSPHNGSYDRLQILLQHPKLNINFSDEHTPHILHHIRFRESDSRKKKLQCILDHADLKISFSSKTHLDVLDSECLNTWLNWYLPKKFKFRVREVSRLFRSHKPRLSNDLWGYIIKHEMLQGLDTIRSVYINLHQILHVPKSIVTKWKFFSLQKLIKKSYLILLYGGIYSSQIMKTYKNQKATRKLLYQLSQVKDNLIIHKVDINKKSIPELINKLIESLQHLEN